MAKLYISSDLLVQVNSLVDSDSVAITDADIADNFIVMTLYEATPLNPNAGDAVSGEQVLIPTACATSYLAFTDAGASTYEVKIGDKVTGDISGATATVVAVTLTSGTWAGADPAGYLELGNQVGTFQAENLDVGTNTDACTITSDTTTRTFTLTFEGDTTGALDNYATRAEIETALDGLGDLNGKVNVTGNPLNTYPVTNGVIITFDDDLGKVGPITIEHSNLVGPSTISADISTEGHLSGDVANAGGGDVTIPIEGHKLIVGNYIRIEGSINYDILPDTVGSLLWPIKAVARDSITFAHAYTAEALAGDEEIYIGVGGTEAKNVALAHVAAGTYTGLLPEDVRRVLRNKKFALFINISIDGAPSSDLTIVEELSAVYYS